MKTRWRSKQNPAYLFEGELVLKYEVHCSSVDDDFDYRDENFDPLYLFDYWCDKYGDREQLPIHWYASMREKGKFEFAPFTETVCGMNWLTFYEGWAIDWFQLPVQIGKGEFINMATGWKPSALQPTVQLSLLKYLADFRRPAYSIGSADFYQTTLIHRV